MYEKLGKCLVFLVVMQNLDPTKYALALTCQDFPRDVEVTAKWWSARPYVSKSDSPNGTRWEGIFPELFAELQNRTGLKIKYGEPFLAYSNFTKTTQLKTNQSIIFPVMAEQSDRVYADKCFVPVVLTKGPAYFIHIEEMIPLTLLGKGLLQGWQIIALTVVLAAISGVFIWIMDRKSNQEDFPAAFFPGIWQGFWWAFVTMTTVGYGDTVPRSIPARVYCVLWMIIGMIAFSVLTANITSSLSKQTFDAEEKLFGTKVGVLEGTMDAKAALLENANVNNYNSMDTLLSSMKAGRVDGLLIERYMAGAFYNEYKAQGLELGTMLEFPYHMGLLAPDYIAGFNPPKGHATCEIFKNCVLDILKEKSIVERYLTNISDRWRNFKASESTSLFEDESFFYILIGFFVALCVAGALWHYFVFIPSTRQETNGADESVEEGKSQETEQIVLLRNELTRLCSECCDKIETIVKENPNREAQHQSLAAALHIATLTPNIKRLSTNAFGQLRNLPINTVGQLPEFVGQQRKRAGRIVK